jgi:hypothetical protein
MRRAGWLRAIISVPLHVFYLLLTIPLDIAGILFEIAHAGPEDTGGVWRSSRNAQLEARRWLFGPSHQESEHSDGD